MWASVSLSFMLNIKGVIYMYGTGLLLAINLVSYDAPRQDLGRFVTSPRTKVHKYSLHGKFKNESSYIKIITYTFRFFPPKD